MAEHWWLCCFLEWGGLKTALTMPAFLYEQFPHYLFVISQPLFFHHYVYASSKPYSNWGESHSLIPRLSLPSQKKSLGTRQLLNTNTLSLTQLFFNQLNDKRKIIKNWGTSPQPSLSGGFLLLGSMCLIIDCSQISTLCILTLGPKFNYSFTVQKIKLYYYELIVETSSLLTKLGSFVLLSSFSVIMDILLVFFR